MRVGEQSGPRASASAHPPAASAAAVSAPVEGMTAAGTAAGCGWVVGLTGQPQQPHDRPRGRPRGSACIDRHVVRSPGGQRTAERRPAAAAAAPAEDPCAGLGADCAPTSAWARSFNRWAIGQLSWPLCECDGAAPSPAACHCRRWAASHGARQCGCPVGSQPPHQPLRTPPPPRHCLCHCLQISSPSPAPTPRRCWPLVGAPWAASACGCLLPHLHPVHPSAAAPPCAMHPPPPSGLQPAHTEWAGR